jgi:putative ABC transport system permease protein
MREDVDLELSFHIEERATEIMARTGLNRADALAEAERRFGNIDGYRRQLRAIDSATHRQTSMMEFFHSFVRETGQALRSLRRAPSFSLLAVLTLALGLGASTAIFTLLDRIVLRPLEYRNSTRLIHVGTKWPGVKAGEEYGISRYMYFQFKESSRALENIGIYTGEFLPLPSVNGLDAERVAAADVSASLFDVLSIRPALGRRLVRDDERSPEPTVAVLSHALWQRRFGGDPAIIGRTIDMGGAMIEIVGVLPASARLPDRDADVWLPMYLDPTEPPRNSHVFTTIALLKEGVSVDEGYRDLDALTRRITEEFPGVYDKGFLQQTCFALAVRSLHDEIVGPDITRALWIIFSSVALVLLIAVANVAGLFLVRVDARRREVAVRSAIGANRRRLAIHSLSESMLLAAGAAAAAIAMALWLVRVVLAFAPAELPRLREVRLDASGILFCCAVAAAVGAIFGLLPLFGTSMNADALRDGGRGFAGSSARSATRRAVVVVQVALSIVLLAGAGMMAKSFNNLRSVRMGFEPKGVLAMSIALRPDRYTTDAQLLAFWHELAEKVAALPGVKMVGGSSSLPLSGDGGCTSVRALESPLPHADQSHCSFTETVSPGYFVAMGIAITGNEPTWNENESGSGTMVISRSLAQRFWPGENAIGKSLIYQQRRRLVFRIAGIAEDVRANGLDKPPIEAAYFPIAAPATAGPTDRSDMDGNYMHLVVKSTAVDIGPLGVAVRRIVNGMDSRVPVADVRSMQQVVAKSLARTSFTMLLLALAASIALLLSAVGLYGVISYTVLQRRAEIGVRMALGARTEQMRQMVVSQSIRLTIFGIGAGLLLAIAVLRALRSFLFETSPVDPTILFGAALTLLGVAWLASHGPAKRAAAVDPAEALRSD